MQLTLYIASVLRNRFSVYYINILTAHKILINSECILQKKATYKRKALVNVVRYNFLFYNFIF